MKVLVTRLDGAGDVLLAGPAINAVSRKARVTLLCSSTGLPAARLLPGIDPLVFDAPWVHADPPPVRRPSASPARASHRNREPSQRP